MTGFKMTFDYDGDQGQLSMDIKNKYSKWHQLDGTGFQRPDDVTLKIQKD